LNEYSKYQRKSCQRWVVGWKGKGDKDYLNLKNNYEVEETDKEKKGPQTRTLTGGKARGRGRFSGGYPSE